MAVIFMRLPGKCCWELWAILMESRQQAAQPRVKITDLQRDTLSVPEGRLCDGNLSWCARLRSLALDQKIGRAHLILACRFRKLHYEDSSVITVLAAAQA